MKKITLAVLFGGSSTEYEISLQSAHAVLTHLDRDRYEPVLLGITRDGRWLLYQGPVDALLDDTWHTDARHTVPAVISPDRGACCSSPPLGPLPAIWTPPFRYSMAKTGRTARCRACWSWQVSP